MDKLKCQTTNIVDENIKRIGECFPNWQAKVEAIEKKAAMSGKPIARWNYLEKYRNLRTYRRGLWQ